MTNHCCTHKCSKYCWRARNVTQKFKLSKPHNVPKKDVFTRNGERWVTTLLWECRLGYGDKLEFDTSGENNLTRGIEPVHSPYISFDKNGQTTFFARRNHPWVLHQLHGFSYFGANNDMVILLINAVSKHLIEELGCEANEEYSNNLVLDGFLGLEHYYGAHIIEIYTTGYQCKGNQQSQTWSKISHHLMNMQP
jgi:hypothetical protein